MTPRDIIVLAIGVLLGVFLQGGKHGSTCLCHGCDRDRWKRGGAIAPNSPAERAMQPDRGPC